MTSPRYAYCTEHECYGGDPADASEFPKWAVYDVDEDDPPIAVCDFEDDARRIATSLTGALNPDDFPKIDVAIDGRELAAWFAKHPPLAPFALRHLMPEEIKHLNQSERCPDCEHLAVLHYENWCEIDGCDCFIVGGPRT